MGSVRIKRANPLTILLGTSLVVFIVYFLFVPSSSSASRPAPPSPFHKTSTGVRASPPPVVRYDMNSVTVTKDPEQNKEKILILTPMARFYQGYWDNLLQLNYPHELITLGFILPKNKEGNAATAALQAEVAKTQKGPIDSRFKEVIILRQDFEPPLTSQDESERHKLNNQKERRAAMSKARNSLIFTTLGPMTSWVLWLDADIVETPPTLIQDLASHDQPVIVPNCFQRYTNSETNQDEERPYDFNSWQDSQSARDLAAKMGPDDILLEGYAEMPTYRALMAYMVEENKGMHHEVPLDGVGGTALMVKADVHRDGAMFPPFSFYHLMETEGFCKMARRLTWTCTGLPNYKVYHYNE
ncbi:mannan polymerase complexes MNN9 subunit [Zalerion maritima]|uniref:Mannan polymerase complexes MNN9 subunit n=1 Tax=Zalerion maritima TaxID=339359 RepID=A0AAD5WSR1_9PEZI|nr:mannan polymerase complexes MNN9 subunit [Zalerion maritima]